MRQFGDSFAAVSIDEHPDCFNGLITLNRTGAFLWNLMSKQDCTFSFLLSQLTEHFDVNLDTAKTDLESFIAIAQSAGLLYE